MTAESSILPDSRGNPNEGSTVLRWNHFCFMVPSMASPTTYFALRKFFIFLVGKRDHQPRLLFHWNVLLPLVLQMTVVALHSERSIEFAHDRVHARRGPMQHFDVVVHVFHVARV